MCLLCSLLFERKGFFLLFFVCKVVPLIVLLFRFVWIWCWGRVCRVRGLAVCVRDVLCCCCVVLSEVGEDEGVVGYVFGIDGLCLYAF